MEAAAEQEGVVCVCAENRKKHTLRGLTQLHGGGGAPGRSLVFQMNLLDVRLEDYFLLTVRWKCFCPWVSFLLLAAHSCCLSAQSCGLRHAANKMRSGLVSGFYIVFKCVF